MLMMEPTFAFLAPLALVSFLLPFSAAALGILGCLREPKKQMLRHKSNHHGDAIQAVDSVQGTKTRQCKQELAWTWAE
jgi:hypothetical protein